MKAFPGLWLAFSAFGAQGLQFAVTDGNGKQTSAVSLEAGVAGEDGWQPIRISKAKGNAVLVWPFDGLAKSPDGPEPIPAIVMPKGDEKARSNKALLAALATPIVLGLSSIADVAEKSGYSAELLAKSFAELTSATDAFQMGVGLLYTGEPAEAAEQLGVALKQRQRQLTRVPSEIYPAALLYGLALFRAARFDDAAVAFLAAMKQRPSSALAENSRAEALVKAGKGEAAGR
jgi:hypothetical protein